mmetsp:Transcript_29253/g.71061  ORF Transcript_29253/g.71061 Transcript_29253/m.71061 type:complete len:543 (-) Transcript_29253:65-1693(-)
MGWFLMLRTPGLCSLKGCEIKRGRTQRHVALRLSESIGHTSEPSVTASLRKHARDAASKLAQPLLKALRQPLPVELTRCWRRATSPNGAHLVLIPRHDGLGVLRHVLRGSLGAQAVLDEEQVPQIMVVDRVARELHASRQRASDEPRQDVAHQWRRPLIARHVRGVGQSLHERVLLEGGGGDLRAVAFRQQPDATLPAAPQHFHPPRRDGVPEHAPAALVAHGDHQRRARHLGVTLERRSHVADDQVRQPVGVVEARVARVGDRRHADGGRQRHVRVLHRLLAAARRRHARVDAEVGHELIREHVARARLAHAGQARNEGERPLRRGAVVDAVRAQHEELLEPQRLLWRLPVARADGAQRLHGAADATEEQPLDPLVRRHLVEHSERRAERRLHSPPAQHLRRGAAQQRRGRGEAVALRAARRHDDGVDLARLEPREGDGSGHASPLRAVDAHAAGVDDLLVHAEVRLAQVALAGGVVAARAAVDGVLERLGTAHAGADEGARLLHVPHANRREAQPTVGAQLFGRERRGPRACDRLGGGGG